ncbi:hypothetical protein ILYODFUR_027397 [Ilyodon furcidens]|uniref:Secreted protein n=1 Tax=Ilyodon furcidens TaxID=33524 RepID=A0ABV0T3Y7_9TELE
MVGRLILCYIVDCGLIAATPPSYQPRCPLGFDRLSCGTKWPMTLERHSGVQQRANGPIFSKQVVQHCVPPLRIAFVWLSRCRAPFPILGLGQQTHLPPLMCSCSEHSWRFPSSFLAQNVVGVITQALT